VCDKNKDVSSREWEQIHEKSASQTGGWYMELEEVLVRKKGKLFIGLNCRLIWYGISFDITAEYNIRSIGI